MKTNSLRKSLIALFTVIFVAFTAAFVASVNVAKADPVTTFEFESGAYVKLSGDGGMRFRLKMDETTATEIKGNDNETLYFYVASAARMEVVTTGTAAKALNTAGNAWEVVADKNKIYAGEDGQGDPDGFYYANILLDINKLGADAAAKLAYRTTDFVAVAAVYDTSSTSYTKFVKSVDRSLQETASAGALRGGYYSTVKTTYDWLGSSADYRIIASNADDYTALATALASDGDLYFCLDGVEDTNGLMNDYDNGAYAAKVNLTGESKENYSYSANLRVSASGANAYIGGYVFYADESNNISYRISISTDVLSVISVVAGVETSYDVNLTALDYANGVDVLVEKVGTNYQIAINDKLVYANTLAFAGAGKSGWISDYATVTATGVTFATLNAFTEKDILFGIHENVVHVGDEAGSWQINGNAITSNCYASYEALFLNYANGVKPMANVNDVSLTVVATYGTNHPQGDGRTGFRIYLDGTHFVDAYYINKGNVGDIVYYGAIFGGGEGWLLPNEGGYYDDIPNYVADEPVEMQLEKVGNTINFYANGVFLRGITADFIEDSWISIINKHNSRTYTVTEYKTISELTAVTYGLLAGTNMAKSYSDGKYTFEQSASGYWGGALPGLEGGLTIALVNEWTSCDYTFVSKVKIATESTSNGTAGVMGFWKSGSNKSWLYFDKNGNMDILYDSYGGYSGVTKNIGDFGLTVDDEIPVRVVKAGNRLDYYVNGTLAYTLEHNSIDTFGSPGFVGAIPVADSGMTGQYGATFEIVSLTLS